MDLTELQTYFLSLMTSEDIVNTKNRDKKLNLILKSLGYELKDDNDRDSVRGQAKQRIEERRLKKNG